MRVTSGCLQSGEFVHVKQRERKIYIKLLKVGISVLGTYWRLLLDILLDIKYFKNL